MNRREFVKTLCAAGLAAPNALQWLSAAEATGGSYSGPLLLFIHARGGWDAPSFFDPKAELNRGFGIDDIENAGGLRYAPLEWRHNETGEPHALGPDFIQEFSRRMIVVNGINMQTNAHLPGHSNAYQGSFSTSYPTLSAAFAAARAPDLFMSYLVTGTYRSTGNLLPFSLVQDGNALSEIARPNHGGLPNGLNGLRIPTKVFEMAARYQSESLQLASDNERRLPLDGRHLRSFFDVSSDVRRLDTLANTLPPNGFRYFDELGVRNGLVQQIDVALHAMASGLSAAADVQLLRGNFDSHVNHHAEQSRWFANLVYALRFLWNRCEEIDTRVGTAISDRLTVVITSEFGRAPHFNSDGGTDHWPTTSALIMSKAFETNGMGSRTVGWSTNDGRYRPGRINPVSLELDDNGVELTSAHLHKALRRYLGIVESPVLAPFGLDVEDVNIFTPRLTTPQT